ncbi:hypothetical protein M0208_00005 [Sphingomonas sp. SUN019]|uniref:hypothetical protein n=1 Tax=Sphingomonas sp. SUN019 TaxID=2937788 RepID=UPI00216479DF|nr:hypothetical protein [Sphingomonas sp. SUN019]UVO48984.1 hypothetical protein M0208_00005 [Sphingomonas sp. SUN019]
MTMKSLDPFGYWPTFRSRITGLGGEDEPSDLSYILHSSYTAVEPGPAIATVAFEGLAASAGLIEVSVFQLHAEHTPQVTQAGKAGALLSTLARTNRPVRIAFEAIPGAEYAVIGQSFGDCRARAHGVTIGIGPRSATDDLARHRSQFGRLKARLSTALASTERPSLRAPVSQGFSHAQLTEGDFTHWATWLPADDTPESRWEAAYILRTLEAYGRLEKGARGLGFARDADPVAAIAETVGCTTMNVTLRPDEEISAAIDRTIADRPDGVGFDFLWTRGGVMEGLGPVRAETTVGDLLDRLRPGGLAIHIFAAGNDIRDDVFDSNALNRLALGLVADGHIVAQLRHDHHDDGPRTRLDPIVPFGIVVRRATEMMN